jgi:uncharacterized damage-inducible protein DinB
MSNAAPAASVPLKIRRVKGPFRHLSRPARLHCEQMFEDRPDSTAAAVLQGLLGHHAWATSQLLHHCRSQGPELLEATVPGTYGTVLAILVHLLAAEQRYLELLTGELPADPLREGARPGLDELQARAEALAERWRRLLPRLHQLSLTLPARAPYPELQRAELLLLIQALHHGNDHRTQICTILGALDLEVPDLDGWAYWLAQGP